MFTFENFKTKHSAIYRNLDEGSKEEYQKVFQAALKKFGADSPADLEGDKKKAFFDYIDKTYVGDHEEDDPTAEAYEVGTKEYTDHCKKVTPGEEIEEKAVSQQQQKLMGLAYAVKKGDIEPPSAQIQKLADSMSLDELKKMAEGKHEDLPVKKEEVDKSKEGKEVAEKIDARKKIFKEKLRKLAYEKAKRMNKTDNSVAEKNLETVTVKNKIKINPEIREYRALNTFKKYSALLEQQDNSLEQQIVDYLKEGSSDGGPAFAALGISGEHDAHGNTVDYPASASSIARAFQLSPVTVQEVLDKMTRMGTITRVGDAYSYGSVEAVNA